MYHTALEERNEVRMRNRVPCILRPFLVYYVCVAVYDIGRVFNVAAVVWPGFLSRRGSS